MEGKGGQKWGTHRCKPDTSLEKGSRPLTALKQHFTAMQTQRGGELTDHRAAWTGQET